MLVTDGRTPINLMGFGQGLLGGLNGAGAFNRAASTSSTSYRVEERE